jgi:hypothetical protein
VKAMALPSQNIPEKLELERSQRYPNIPQEKFFSLVDFLFFIRL